MNKNINYNIAYYCENNFKAICRKHLFAFRKYFHDILSDNFGICVYNSTLPLFIIYIALL